MPSKEQLAIYLNDHLAGSAAGRDLADKIARKHEGRPAGPTLAQLAREISEDQEALAELMRRLEIGQSRIKVAAGSLAERASRLVFELGVEGDSDLNQFLELESLLLGVNGKRALWQALRAVAATRSDWPGVDLDRLLARADSQIQRLSRLHLEAAVASLGG
jgi:hypothetical protein